MGRSNSGSEVPKENRDEVNNDLEEVTEYVFEILQNSNFAQEVHESFMDLAVGTGVLVCEEGDAINPIRFSAIPLPHVILDTGPDDRYRSCISREKEYTLRSITFCYILNLYFPLAATNSFMHGC